MKAKALLRSLVVLTALALPFAASAGELFTGDTKLACEAVLCLSTGQRPSECSPPLRRYFSITARKLSDTIKKRRNFLKLCPTANKDDKMRQLVDDIVNGAGRCDAKSLNSTMMVYVGGYIDNPKRLGMRYIDRDLPGEDGRWVIRNTMPSHCAAYANNAYTDQTTSTTARYVGDPEHGGRWVDAEDYESALAEYNAQQAADAWNNDGTDWNGRNGSNPATQHR